MRRPGYSETDEGGIEPYLSAAENAALAILAEHAKVVEEAIAKLTPDEQKAARSTAGGVFGPVPIVEHDEPRRRPSKLPPRACERCPAAHRLLFHLSALRRHVKNGDAENAALFALCIGWLELRLGLSLIEDDADRGRAFANAPQRPRQDLLNRELERRLADKPDLTAAEVLAAWKPFKGAPACIVDVEPDGKVIWTNKNGSERTTSADGIRKRLQRLRQARAHQQEERTLID
jgi:hypothetical protein